MIEKKYAYMRESTSKQATADKNGLKAQRNDIISWLYAHDIDPEDVEFIEDRKSGGSIKRPGFSKILNDINNPKIKVSLLITQTDDRIMRNVEETINFMNLIEKHEEISFIIINGFMDYSTATNKYMTNNKAAASQFWIDKTREDTIDRMKAAARKGRYSIPKCPLGFIKDKETKKLSIDEEKHAKFIELGEMIASNEYSLKSLLYYCQKNKLMNIKWTYEKIYALFSNPISNGTFYWKTQNFYIPDHSPKLYDDDLWLRIQEAKKRRKMVNTHQYLFKNKIYCSSCKVLCSQSCTIRPYKVYKYYVCDKCKKRINEEFLIKELMPEIKKRLDKEEKEKFITAMQNKMEKIDNLIALTKKDYMEDLIDQIAFDKSIEDYTIKKSILKGDIRDLQDMKKIEFEKLDRVSKKELINKIIDKIYLSFDPYDKNPKIKIKKK